MSIDAAPAPPEHRDLIALLPADTVTFYRGRLPLPNRMPARAWGFLLRAVRMLPASDDAVPSLDDPPATAAPGVETADLVAGIWLPQPPPPDLHDGDLVIRLAAPGDRDPARVDVQLWIAQNDVWQLHQSWARLDRHWPHVVAPVAEFLMRITSDNIYARALDNRAAPLSHVLMDHRSRCTSRRPLPAPDALALLVDARLIHVGAKLSCGPHEVTVAAGGVLTGDVPNGIATVSACASDLAGGQVNGWHLWFTAAGELLDDLRIRYSRHR